MVDCDLSEAIHKCPNTCTVATTATTTASLSWATTTAPAAVALLTGSFSLALSEPADLARAFEQGDRAVSAALASGVAAVLPTATPDMVDITGVAFDGRLLSTAARSEARSGSASVRVSFETTMLAASSLVANSAQDFLQAADGLETSLALELAGGALNFTVFHVSDLQATLDFVAAANTTTLSGSANNGAATNFEFFGLVMLVSVAICCVSALIWRQSRKYLRKSRKDKRDIRDHDAVPAVNNGPGLHPVFPIVPFDDDVPPQPPCTLRPEALTGQLLFHPQQQAPGEEEDSESIVGRDWWKMTIPGVQVCPLSMVQDVRRHLTLAGALEQEPSVWRFKVGELATLEGVWEMPWSEKRPSSEVNNNCSVVEVSYR